MNRHSRTRVSRISLRQESRRYLIRQFDERRDIGAHPARAHRGEPGFRILFKNNDTHSVPGHPARGETARGSAADDGGILERGMFSGHAERSST